MTKITVLFVICAGLALAGCNTFKGIGQDVQKAGSVLEEAAKK